MALKDLLKKREKIKGEEQKTPPKPEFTFMRTTTTTQELVTLPSFDGENNPSSEKPAPPPKTTLRSHFRNSSISSTSSTKSAVKLPRLNLRRHSTTSSNVPSDLPTISDSGEKGGKDEQAKWEERATILAQKNRSRASTVSTSYAGSSGTPQQVEWQTRFDKEEVRPPVGGRNVSDEQGDVCCPALPKHTP